MTELVANNTNDIEQLRTRENIRPKIITWPDVLDFVTVAMDDDSRLAPLS